MVHCQACGITKKARNYGITFHRFPKNEDQRNTWINFINKNKGLHENFKCTTLCSQHFDASCFDRTSAEKVRLKLFSVPTIHISRSKYDKITAMTVRSQTGSINETSQIDATATNKSITDTAMMDCSSDMHISKIMEESTVNDSLQMDKSQLNEQVNVDIKSQSSNRNVDIKSLPSTSSDMLSCETDVPMKTLPNDTPEKVILKNKVVSLGRSLVEKSNAIRKLQKKNWNQQKQISKLKSVIHQLYTSLVEKELKKRKALK
ncbi:uncharacterized protein [Polyergus mexicanus]|uniref:uncharacterized protein isoform X1 n=1 Tax=Polyergus mexicanus TaxID=615972 RepID=UPI0038B565AA